MQDKQEWIAFEQTYKRLLKDVAPDNGPPELRETYDRLKKIFEHNVPHGKRNRGLSVVTTYRLLEAQQQNNNISDDDLELARVLGWCVEILQAFFLVIDDMMDQSITRRGQLCWYKEKNVGLIACNDAILIDQSIYQILKLYFSDKTYYVELVNLMHEMSRLTAYGQCLDTLSNPPNGTPQIDIFNQSRYESIVKYKTSYYTFVLPVRLAMYTSNCDSDEEHKYAEEILLKMGYLFQFQDDYLDCYGDPKVIGKIGTDVEEGKCCWPIITALRLGNEKQISIIKNNYGLKDSDAVKRVKDVYNELNLKAVYSEEEELYYKDICKSIDDLKKKSKLNTSIFYEILSKIYHRNK